MKKAGVEWPGFNACVHAFAFLSSLSLSMAADETSEQKKVKKQEISVILYLSSTF